MEWKNFGDRMEIRTTISARLYFVRQNYAGGLFCPTAADHRPDDVAQQRAVADRTLVALQVEQRAKMPGQIVVGHGDELRVLAQRVPADIPQRLDPVRLESWLATAAMLARSLRRLRLDGFPRCGRQIERLQRGRQIERLRLARLTGFDFRLAWPRHLTRLDGFPQRDRHPSHLAAFFALQFAGAH